MSIKRFIGVKKQNNIKPGYRCIDEIDQHFISLHVIKDINSRGYFAGMNMTSKIFFRQRLHICQGQRMRI